MRSPVPLAPARPYKSAGPQWWSTEGQLTKVVLEVPLMALFKQPDKECTPQDADVLLDSVSSNGAPMQYAGGAIG